MLAHQFKINTQDLPLPLFILLIPLDHLTHFGLPPSLELDQLGSSFRDHLLTIHRLFPSRLAVEPNYLDVRCRWYVINTSLSSDSKNFDYRRQSTAASVGAVRYHSTSLMPVDFFIMILTSTLIDHIVTWYHFFVDCSSFRSPSAPLCMTCLVVSHSVGHICNLCGYFCSKIPLFPL